MYIHGVNATKIYESEMLSLIEHRECNVEVRITISKITVEEYTARIKLPYDQEMVEMHSYSMNADQFMVLNNQNSLRPYSKVNEPIYKLFINISNDDENATCFPNNMYAEMYNVDHTNLQGKVFKYCLVYLVLTCFQIYLTSYEYLNLLSVPIEKRQSISATSIAHHSLWNFLSMVLHLIMGLQIFIAF